MDDGYNNSGTSRDYAYLRATGVNDPSVITERLNIDPDRSYMLGDLMPAKKGRTTLKYRQSLWRLNSQLADTDPLEQHVNTLLSRVVTQRSVLLELQEFFAFQIVCVSTGGNFSFVTSLEMQRLATACGFTFWFDIYPDSEPHEKLQALQEQLDAALDNIDEQDVS